MLLDGHGESLAVAFVFIPHHERHSKPLSIAGKNAHRVDGIEKVTGKAIYTGDIQLAGDGAMRDTA